MPAELGTARILVVDDSPATVRLLTAYLVSGGYDVLTAATPDEAEDLVRAGAPELVLLDLAGAGHDRGGLCSGIKAAAPVSYTPVILSLEADDVAARSGLRDSPADDLIGKPYQRAELLLRVGSMLRLRSLREQLAQKTSELECARALLRRQAITDKLTGLHNRCHLEAFVSVELARAPRRDRKLSLVMLAIAGFREFNDREGHRAGDRLLIEVASRLRAEAPPPRLAARYGGKCFVLVLPETDRQSAGDFATGLERRLADCRMHAMLRADVGIVTYPDDGSDAYELIRAAERNCRGSGSPREPRLAS